MRPDRFKRDHHLRNGVLDLGMVSHRPGESERTFALRSSNASVESSFGQAVINIGEAHQSPGKHGEDKRIDSSAPGRNDTRNVSVWNESALQNRVIAARGAHAENVPGFLNDVAAAVARHKYVNDLRMAGVTGIHSMHAETRPDRRQAAKLLAARETIPAVHTLCFRGGEQHWDIVATLGVTGGKDLAGGSVAQHPFERGISSARKIGSNADPIEMHIHCECRCWRVIREPPLLAAHFGETQTGATKFLRNRHDEIFRGAEFFEI